MTIWAVKGLANHACVVIPFKGYEISIAMDDSCGAFKNFYRTDVRVYKDEIDVTDKFLEGGKDRLGDDAETLLKIMKQIESEK